MDWSSLRSDAHVHLPGAKKAVSSFDLPTLVWLILLVVKKMITTFKNNHYNLTVPLHYYIYTSSGILA